jgi:hypothetical protein
MDLADCRLSPVTRGSFVVSLIMLAVVALFPVLLLGLLLLTNGLEGRVVGSSGRRARSGERRRTND